MRPERLALLGGRPVRRAEFRSRPRVGAAEIRLVAKLMREGRFSRFVGSPVAGTRELLRRSSRDLVFTAEGACFLGGDYVRRFEAAWSRVTGARYCVSVNSATSGLSTALLAAGVSPGDEVVTTPFSFTATATSIVLANAVPVFSDIDLDTFCLSPQSLERSISSRARCVMPVHWCGNAGDFKDVLKLARRRGLLIVEDSAQAPATTYAGRALGTFGDAGVFSFNEPKNVMTGEGGMIATGDVRIAEKCRLIRNHGEAIPTEKDGDDYLLNVVGSNFRLVELLAAIGWLQTSRIKELHAIRARNYRRLRRRLADVCGEFLIPQRLTHPESYFAYTAAFRWQSQPSGLPRDLVAQALRAEGIPVASGIPRLMCDHPMFQRKLAFGRGGLPWHPGIYRGRAQYRDLPLPNARRLQREYLGFFQTGWPNTEKDMEDIAEAFEKILARKNDLAGLASKTAPGSFVLGR